MEDIKVFVQMIGTYQKTDMSYLFKNNKTFNDEISNYGMYQM